MVGGRYRSLQVFPGKVAADRLQEFMQGLGFRASRLRQMDSFLHSPRRTSELFSFSRSRSLSLSLLVYNIYLYIYVCILATIFFLYLCVVLSILCMHTHTHARCIVVTKPTGFDVWANSRFSYSGTHMYFSRIHTVRLRWCQKHAGARLASKVVWRRLMSVECPRAPSVRRA